MLSNRSRTTLASLIAAFALVASACGGGSTSTEADNAAPAETDESSSADDTTSDDATTESGDAVTVEAGSTDAENAAWPHTFVEDGVGGGLIDANSLEGQDVVLWFWAPW